MKPLLLSIFVCFVVVAAVGGGTLLPGLISPGLPFLIASAILTLIIHAGGIWVNRERPFTYSSQWHIALVLAVCYALAQLAGGLFHGRNVYLLFLGAVLIASSTNIKILALVLTYFIFAAGALYLSDVTAIVPYHSGIQWERAPLFTFGFTGVLGVGLSLLISHELILKRIRFFKARADYKTGENHTDELPSNVNTIGVMSLPQDAPEHGPVSREKMKEALDSVLFFVSRNFKATNAMGFLLSDELPDRLELVSFRARSADLKKPVSIRPGVGVLGRALKKKEAFTSGDLRSYPVKLEYAPENKTINSIMAVPISDGVRTKGMLVVDSENHRAFNDEDKELLSRMAAIALAMISNVLLSQQVQLQARRLDTIYQSTQKLNRVLKVDEVFALLAEELAQLFPQMASVICLNRPASGMGKIWNATGSDTALKGKTFSVKTKGSLYGYALRKGKRVLVRDLAQKKEYFRFDRPEPNPPRDLLLVPITSDRGEVLGVAGLESRARSLEEGPIHMLTALLANFSNALAKARSYADLERLATVDGLTQIPNHRKFQEVMENEISRVERYGESVTLLLMDIDHFKTFNDTYGHPVGDAVLRLVAKTLQGQIRKTDFCARYGGEEFVAVLVGSDGEKSRPLTERIRAAIENAKLEHGKEALHITVSIGSATYPGDAVDKQELIDNADKAMYHSKESGRNRVTAYGELINSSVSQRGE